MNEYLFNFSYIYLLLKKKLNSPFKMWNLKTKLVDVCGHVLGHSQTCRSTWGHFEIKSLGCMGWDTLQKLLQVLEVFVITT